MSQARSTEGREAALRERGRALKAELAEARAAHARELAEVEKRAELVAMDAEAAAARGLAAARSAGFAEGEAVASAALRTSREGAERERAAARAEAAARDAELTRLRSEVLAAVEEGLQWRAQCEARESALAATDEASGAHEWRVATLERELEAQASLITQAPYASPRKHLLHHARMFFIV